MRLWNAPPFRRIYANEKLFWKAQRKLLGSIQLDQITQCYKADTDIPFPIETVNPQPFSDHGIGPLKRLPAAERNNGANFKRRGGGQ